MTSRATARIHAIQNARLRNVIAGLKYATGAQVLDALCHWLQAGGYGGAFVDQLTDAQTAAALEAGGAREIEGGGSHGS